MRGIDHLVLAVRDLDAARAFYAGLGFQLTPVARHPWGTWNSLVQFDGVFLELLTVASPTRSWRRRPGALLRGLQPRRARAAGRATMLVLDSADEAADRSDFAVRGLPLYEPSVSSGSHAGRTGRSGRWRSR